MKKGFTLAEVLITITIIGVVAALSIPSVIVKQQQKEYKTGLKKAIATLNQAIALNLAMEDQTPADANNTFAYFARHMNVIKSTTNLREWKDGFASGNAVNAALWTADGMRFEFGMGTIANHQYDDVYDDDGNLVANGREGSFLIANSAQYNKLNPGQPVYACRSHLGGRDVSNLPPALQSDNTLALRGSCMGCGSNGLRYNPNNTTKPPCIIVVDVNGDKKPSPPSTTCRNDETHDISSCSGTNRYKWPNNADVQRNKMTDMFFVMITDRGAVPLSLREANQKTIFAND